ncbi:MAG: GAF domain-containing protein [Anaerolineales bacterium]
MPNNLSEDTPQAALQTIKKSLQRLSERTLPPDEGQALIQARQALSKLELMFDEHQSPQLEGLYRVSQSLGASLELEEVLSRVIDAVIELTGAERGYVLLLDPDTQQLAVQAARGSDGGNLDEDDQGFSRSVVRAVVEHGAGVVTTDAQKDPRFADQQSVIIQALRSVICVPLRRREQTIGVIYVDHRVQAGIFTDEDLSLLEAFAAQAAVAIENARLYTLTDRRLAERVAELEMLGEITRQLNATLDLDSVATLALQWALRGSQAARGWVALEAPENAGFEIVASEPGDEAVPLEESAITVVWQSGQPAAFPPQADRPAYLSAPILRSGKPVGVIIVSGPQPFSDTTLQFLTRLAGHASIALDNARLHQAVQQTNQAKSQFISVVVHELRIPMTAIKGYTDLLRQGAVGAVSEAQLNFLEVIRKNVDRMATLISDLSDLNRVESGRLKLAPSEISLYSVVQETVKSLGPKLAEKDQSLQVEVPEDLPELYADPQRIAQVFGNLLNNAWKYTPAGGAIQVRAEHFPTAGDQPEHIRVSVADNGIGISAEDQESLFTPFFRSEAAAVREEQGWGLGLSVAKSLLDVMGGEIGAHSQEGSGSTFWFTLPVENSD